ncbi:hypothetical protein KUV57_12235 [Epibacterium sp. DP7N7-1]|nr:hypothetical protein [Epibacterium sp. DP7N7-1]
MTWYKDKHGLAAYEDLSIGEMERRIKEGVRFYASLGGLILNEGVQATSFSAFTAVSQFDGVVALRLGSTKDLSPVDIVASYDIEVLDGKIQRRPTNGEEVRQAYWQAERIRTGVRQYSVATLDFPANNVRLVFKSGRRSDVEAQIAAAVRLIYPEEESLYSAIAAHDLSLRRGYAKGRPDDAMVARFTDSNGRVSFFLGETPQELVSKAFRELGGRPDEDIVKFLDLRTDYDFQLGFLPHNEANIERAIEMRREAETDTDMSL